MTETATYKTVKFLTATMAAIGFVLSYQVLYNVAVIGGKPASLALLWPVIIDGPIVAFTLAAYLAASVGQSRVLPTFGVVILSALTIGFNGWYHWGSYISVIVGCTAPLMYLASFEALLWTVNLSPVKDNNGPVSKDKGTSRDIDGQETDKALVVSDKPVTQLPPPPETRQQRRDKLPELVNEFDIDTLAEWASVKPRTIYRDIELLRLSVNGKG